MNNQMIGIATVFALTVSLFALRHLLLSLGRPNRNRDVNPTLRRGALNRSRWTSRMIRGLMVGGR
jgi:hypothetical protein